MCFEINLMLSNLVALLKRDEHLSFEVRNSPLINRRNHLEITRSQYYDYHFQHQHQLQKSFMIIPHETSISLLSNAMLQIIDCRKVKGACGP